MRLENGVPIRAAEIEVGIHSDAHAVTAKHRLSPLVNDAHFSDAKEVIPLDPIKHSAAQVERGEGVLAEAHADPNRILLGSDQSEEILGALDVHQPPAPLCLLLAAVMGRSFDRKARGPRPRFTSTTPAAT
jgi:hypothetical protein